jgi:hypothetical protein
MLSNLTRRTRTYILLDNDLAYDVGFQSLYSTTEKAYIGQGVFLCKHPKEVAMAQFMPEKRSAPLKNPPQEKSVAVAIAPVIKTKAPMSTATGSEKRGSQGGRERVHPAEAIIKCQMCGREQKVVFAVGRTPEWHKCIWCGELQPMNGYRVIAYGLGLPRVLAPHEVKARAEYLASLHEGAH